MATIVIGDIHGNLAALLDLLGQLRHEVGEKDVVVFLGDYIDRGHDSRGCIDAILAFRRESPAEVTCLRGNHEDWLLRTQKDYACHSWLLGMKDWIPCAAIRLRLSARCARMSSRYDLSWRVDGDSNARPTSVSERPSCPVEEGCLTAVCSGGPRASTRVTSPDQPMSSFLVFTQGL